MTNTSFFAKSLPSPARALELEALLETVQGIVDTAQQQTEAAVQQALNAQTAAVAAQTAIAGSVGAAAGYADSASGSATSASDSAVLADSSKTSADGSATLAAASAASASVSATNASASATASSGSAAAAAVSATAASGSAINAATSATNAQNSASNAAASASSAASNAAAVVSAIGSADLDAFVRKDGSTMVGPLVLSGDPTVSLGAAPKQYVDRGLFVGEYKEVAFASLPPGWLWADGSAVSRSTYSALFSTIGTTYGAGNGTTTFNLPDRRGRAAFGKDDMGGSAANRLTNAVSGVVGANLGASGGDQRMQQHSHGVSDPTHAHGINDPGHSHTVLSRNTLSGMTAGVVGVWEGESAASTSFSATGVSVAGAATGITVQNSGSGSSQNIPPALVVNVMIYTGVML